MHLTKRSGGRLVAVLSTFALLLGVSTGPASAAPTAAGNKAYSGYSHDVKTYLVDGTVSSGPVVAAGVGCSDKAPLYYQNSAATVNLPGVLTMSNVQTVSQGTKSGSVQTNTSSFSATNLNLPLAGTTGGAIVADAISITNSTNYNTGTGVFTHSSSMTVTNLRVRLTAVNLPTDIFITGNVAPNLGFNLAGIGTLTLHAVQDLGGEPFTAGGRMATAIKLDLLGSLADIAVGETYTSLYGETDQVFMFGEGQALRVDALDEALRVGPLVTAQLPCYGNGGVTAQVLGVNGLPASLGSLGVIKSTATGIRSGLTADATTTSEAADVNLVGGLVTATAVKSTSHVSTTNGGQTVSRAGSGTVLTNLVVNGVPVAANTPPNTYIAIPGGYVIVNAQNDFGVGIEVIALVVHLNAGSVDIVVARTFALLIGPEITAGALRKANNFLSNEMTKQETLANNQRAFTDGTLKKAGILPKH